MCPTGNTVCYLLYAKGFAWQSEVPGRPFCKDLHINSFLIQVME